MREIFKNYYELSNEDFEQLWAQGIFILDTNILLMPYRVPRSSRELLLGLFEDYKERFWIPFQVCLEFQEARLKARKQLPRDATAALEKLRDLKQSLRSVSSREDFEKSAEVRSINAAIRAIENISSEFLVDFGETPHDDPIFSRLTQIFEGRVGPPPANKMEYEALLKDADKRYQGETPPGYKDGDKKGDLRYGGHLYPIKYGDLILWRQIIEKCRVDRIQAVALITDDKKEDWYQKDDGEILGPRHELREEMAAEGRLERFWMYPFERFIRRSNDHWGRKIPSVDIDQLIEAIDASAKAEDGSDWRDWDAARALPRVILKSLLKWLTGRYDEVAPLPQGRGPAVHFRVTGDKGVMVIPWTGGGDINGEYSSSLSAASYLLYYSPDANLILVFCCETEQAANSVSEQLKVYLEEHATKLKDVRERAEIVVGYIAVSEDFITVA